MLLWPSGLQADLGSAILNGLDEPSGTLYINTLTTEKNYSRARAERRLPTASHRGKKVNRVLNACHTEHRSLFTVSVPQGCYVSRITGITAFEVSVRKQPFLFRFQKHPSQAKIAKQSTHTENNSFKSILSLAGDTLTNLKRTNSITDM